MKTNIIGKTATKVSGNMANGFLSVIYHATEVVRVENGMVTLNTGGYFTKTTKTRMNQAANQFGLGFTVYQTKRTWWVAHNGIETPFAANVITFSLSI